MAIDPELEPPTASCYGNSAVADPLPRRHKSGDFFTCHYPLDAARLVFVTMRKRKEASKYNISTHNTGYFCSIKVAAAESLDAHKAHTFMT